MGKDKIFEIQRVSRRIDIRNLIAEMLLQPIDDATYQLDALDGQQIAGDLVDPAGQTVQQEQVADGHGKHLCVQTRRHAVMA